MLGAIVGDIVGSRFEFDNHRDKEFELFGNGVGYTDDSICTIAVADALLKGKSYAASLQDWCRRYPNPIGSYGGGFARWIKEDNPQPYGSYGNGSAMRVSACGWLAERDEVLAEARKSAECTHNHPEGIKGAEATALAIWMLRSGYSKGDLRDTITKQFGYNLNMTCDELRKTYQFDPSCQGTVPQAFVCFLESESFEDTIRLAISIGGDSDTLAAIAGSVAEAYYGIPNEIAAKALTYLPNEMISVIEEFTARYGDSLEPLIKQCHYYDGRDLFPEDPKYMLRWQFEYLWVHSTSVQCEKVVKHYKEAGLADLEPNDGVPMSLKAVLYKGFVQSGNRVCPEGETPQSCFRSWYRNSYMHDAL